VETVSRPWPALWALVIGFFMILVDSTIVSIANPAILRDLQTDITAVIWVTSAYLLSYAVPLLITGRLGDRFGPKRIYLIGLVVFTLASLWCGLSGDIETLIAAAKIAGRRVTVVGTGPLADKVAASPDLDYRGQVTPAQVRAAMREARALLVPSLWYEGLPMVVVEAFALGLPVIASRIGSLAEIVSDDVTGLHAAPGDAADLARAMTRILTDRAASERMSRAARSKYESCWSETVTTNQLLGIYAEAMDSHRTMPIAV
jgi:glycosyltransferase involved in cell wall biosynthesis